MPPSGADVADPAWVIPPGQEALILDMLGRESGHAGCVVQSASPAGDAIDADFRCPDGASVRVHVARLEGPCTNACTDRFDVSIEGSAPAAFHGALVASLRAHEAEFRYEQAGAGDAGPRSHPGFVASDVAVAIGIVVGIGLILRRVVDAKPGRS